jgi:hypothetical protein
VRVDDIVYIDGDPWQHYVLLCKRVCHTSKIGLLSHDCNKCDKVCWTAVHLNTYGEYLLCPYDIRKVEQ